MGSWPNNNEFRGHYTFSSVVFIYTLTCLSPVPHHEPVTKQLQALDILLATPLQFAKYFGIVTVGVA
jgi:hypothetical protein